MRREIRRRIAASASIATLVLVSTSGLAQNEPSDAAPFDVVIERYVADGLARNLALQSETLEVEKATEALAEARARFLPEVSLEARYSRAEGGREFSLPLGSALNSVYSTLNEMLIAQGQNPRFPTVQDE